MRNESTPVLPYGKGISGGWQLVAPVWKPVALKLWFPAGYLPAGFARKTKNAVSLQNNYMTDGLKSGMKILTI
jgi:hypothetical protein